MRQRVRDACKCCLIETGRLRGAPDARPPPARSARSGGSRLATLARMASVRPPALPRQNAARAPCYTLSASAMGAAVWEQLQPHADLSAVSSSFRPLVRRPCALLPASAALHSQPGPRGARRQGRQAAHASK